MITPPKTRLPLEPVCETPQDVETAFAELAWLDSREAEINAISKEAVRQVGEFAQQQMRVDVDGQRVSFADRRTALIEDLARYAHAYREELLADADGAKTREFQCGKLSWRIVPEKLEYAEGENEKTALAKLVKRFDKKLGLVAWLALLIRDFLWNGIHLDKLIRVKPSLDLTGISKLWKSGEVKPAQLKQLGLQVSPETENLSIDVGKYVVRQESSLRE